MRYVFALVALASMATAAPVKAAEDGWYVSYVPYAGYVPYSAAVEEQAAKMAMGKQTTSPTPKSPSL
jgi:hypothetical protein